MKFRNLFLKGLPVILLPALAILTLNAGPGASTTSDSSPPVVLIPAGGEVLWESPRVDPGSLVALQADIPSPNLAPDDSLTLTASADGQRDVSKTLSAGDPGLYIPIRVGEGGALRLRAASASTKELPLRVDIRPLPIPAEDLAAFEAEPNNSWKEATPLLIGRALFGNGDDVDYLDNKHENPIKGYALGLDNPIKDRPGLDWFRVEWSEEDPKLVIFELDILDRDVSVNLRMYKPNAEGSDIELFLDGHDPMEIIHDREPERYSKSITRKISKGTYYLQVIGNHPRYVLRSTVYNLPPYADPQEAARVGAHYIMNVGDAWVAQVPREGNIYRRVQNMHDSTTKCTACHPSIFATEAVLTAQKMGYPITAKSNLQYVVERLYNGPVKMYGPFDVFWQRYIAIPMQSQGKHGMMLMDFEKYVSGVEKPTFLRFAPFLRHAWTGMSELHPDEANGVVPPDSNVGYAVRDWMVLREAYRRTGDRSYLDSADLVRSLVTGPKCDRKNIQDKIHRIWGLAVMGRHNPEEFKDELHTAVEEMMTFQNPDGGWPDVVETGRGSAVYTTGQVIWTLAQAGVTLENKPELKKGIDYILSQQQEFGGWFQTTTHENFRTPMRETRYAVMALAVSHPLCAEPRQGWGNRDGGEGQIPRGDSLLHTLDDLDNLWQVPKGREEGFTHALIPFLSDREPLVRATAAETLGRIGTEASIEPLIGLLDDPVKDVWRAAAWALRQFGNRGLAVEPIKAALNSSDWATRRGAARVFAYQYYGMDERLDIAKDLMRLTRDDNFWTRLEALKSLRQWFYRSNENAFKREIVDLYIDHMGIEEHPAIRTNLAQGMYIMLDENQAGGVSLERNIARFPYERDRKTVLAAREHVEQSVLLEPVLEGLTSGNRFQREALIASFDGTFFAGRDYIKDPTAMIDVGNDREFSFYYRPKESVLERTFESLLSSTDLSAARYAQALKLANFFRLPKKSDDLKIQEMLLAALHHESPEIRGTAREIVKNDLALVGAERSEAALGQLLKLLEDPEMEVRVAALSAIKRNSALLHESRVMAFVSGLLEGVGSDPSLRPLALVVVDTDLAPDKQAIRLIEDTFNESGDEKLRLELVDRLFDRKAMIETDQPTRDLIRVLDTIAGDPVTALREKLLTRLEKTTVLRKSPKIAEVLHSGLSDTSPGIRLRSLKLASEHVEFWNDPATYEYMLRLVIDADPKIRALALEKVREFDLLGKEPRFAGRIKALAEDQELGKAAAELLLAKGYDPSTIQADDSVHAFGIPDLEFFREKVNPIFYEEGADKHSCAECHQNHSILRIAGLPPGMKELSEELIIQNMNSALKVINLSDPEQSLLLRKPRSPQGQGEVPADSPTGLVHVGGPRWDSNSSPAYETILTWIRDASKRTDLRISGTAIADSYSPDYPPAMALDNNPQTIWHTEFVGANPPYPHEIVIDLGAPSSTSAFQYVPRQDSVSGRVKEWELFVSVDGQEWGERVASGEWPNDATVQTIPLRHQGIRFVKLRGLSSVDGQPHMSAAEVIVLRAKQEVAVAR